MKIIVLSKLPRAGKVKTRLVPHLGARRSARLHWRLLRKTLNTAVTSGVAQVNLALTPNRASQRTRALGLATRPQALGDLGQRMNQLCRSHAGPVILLGADCWELQVADLKHAADWLQGQGDCVLGPARDGGYWLLGLRRPQPNLFRHIPWGSAAVLNETRRRIRRLGLNCLELPLRSDIDRPSDLTQIRLEQPGWLR